MVRFCKRLRPFVTEKTIGRMITSGADMRCEERVKQDDATKCFFNVVRDVFEGAESPRFEVLENKEYMECIFRLSASVENVAVKEGLLKLRNSLKEKLLLIDSKIFMNEYTYNVLQNFPKLSAIENRLVVLPFVKKFLRGKLKKMMKKQKRQASIGAEASAERVHKKARH
ncbi:unnamed protein product [Arabis nemorensis]|uniref:DUF629 domain-containing protein n=1 Tax=Arabis nemorensis TaxID=586526 RepID=A0A565BKD1_9BRAS|nr:unnamed protein product [Arabis nemorensis]